MAKKKMTIEDLARMTQEGFKNSDQRLTDFKSEVDEKFMTLTNDLSEVKTDVQLIKYDLAEVKQDVKEMKENASELFAKIDEFISLYKKQEQEMIILNGQLKRLEERVAKLETKTNKK